MAAALLLSFSAAAVLLLARRDALAGLVLDALDRFHLDGRSLLDLATKRNMVLLCHAILLLILRDAGLLGAPARRRAASSATTTSSLVVAAAATAVDDNEEAAICSAPARPRAATTATATSVVVWRRPRSSSRDGASADESGRRLARRRQPRHQPAAAIPSRAEPALSAEPEQHPPLTMISKGIVLVETKAPGNYHLGGGHDRAAAVVGLDHQAAGAACATTTDANKSDYDDRRIVAVSDHDGNANAGTEQTEEEEEEVELADDRRIEEFIAKQWSKMRQESLQLFRSSSGSSSLQQAITAC
ncbi:unnamed protein product [Urochloa decumbens]|uniref:Uncharacterized protein n=1 Tax=Urochloa decumbens TaxID=240449 RepID=A0ABC8XUU6_9POAL